MSSPNNRKNLMVLALFIVVIMAVIYYPSQQNEKMDLIKVDVDDEGSASIIEEPNVALSDSNDDGTHDVGRMDKTIGSHDGFTIIPEEQKTPLGPDFYSGDRGANIWAKKTSTDAAWE
jgi:hypothetical protein